ncbi:MAG: protein kinase [Rhodobacteraceae bacterium]|nr:protein kinase [Paracoccaceae bacterium]MCP5342790.1 protein kinase [Paracoccaceae bacterium]
MGQEKLAAAELPLDGFVDELDPGTKLMNGQYTITRFLNNGGFGITYLAKDSLDRDVVIKECFPNAFCRRSQTLVAARSRAHQGELRAVVKLFVQEARNLSKLIHPNIVGVHQVFEDNGTAYMAIDYIKGRDLLQLIEDDNVTLHPEHIVQMARKMISAVGFVHDHSVLHRDISPDNILLTDTGEPILIDFGAAREQASKKSRALTALRVVKDGYSPQEFYIAGSEQGPWSDLYALAATFYHLISRETPVNGQLRLSALAQGKPDPYVPLAGRVAGYPDGFLEAIDKAMQTLPRNRVQTAHEWLQILDNPPDAPVVSAIPVGPDAPASVDGEPEVAIARMIAQADDIPTPEVVEAPADTSETVEETPATRPIINPEIAHRFAELTVPLDPEPEDDPDEIDPDMDEVPDSDTMIAVQSPPAPEEKIVPQRPKRPTSVRRPALDLARPAPARPAPLCPVKPARSRGYLSTATAILVTISAGLVAFTYLGLPEPTAAVPTDQTAPAKAPLAKTTPVEPTTSAGLSAPEPFSETKAPGEDVANPVAAEVRTSTKVTVSPLPQAKPVFAQQEPAPEPVAVAKIVSEVLHETTPATEAKALPEKVVESPAPVAVAEIQISFAKWDVKLPFEERPAIRNGEQVAVVTRVLPQANSSGAEAWLRPATTIIAVNGNELPMGASAASAAPTDLTIDYDGSARVTFQYLNPGEEKPAKGSVSVPAIRRVGLIDGTDFAIKVIEGKWQTIVTSTPEGVTGGLRPGDILVRELGQDMPVNAPDSFEKIIAIAAGNKTPEIEFNLFRNKTMTTVWMPLASE